MNVFHSCDGTYIFIRQVSTTSFNTTLSKKRQEGSGNLMGAIDERSRSVVGAELCPCHTGPRPYYAHEDPTT